VAASWRNWPRRWSACACSWKARPTSSATCTLTHELKSPLAAIRGAAELLKARCPASSARFVGNIAGESQRLQQLIERLLNLAQVEQRQGLEERVRVPLRELVDALLQANLGRLGGHRWRTSSAPTPRYSASPSCCARRWATCSTTPWISPRRRPAALQRQPPRPVA
jgi:signal transduction histidine kinase